MQVLTRTRATELFRDTEFRDSCPELTQFYIRFDQFLRDARRKRSKRRNEQCSSCKQLPRPLYNRLVTVVRESETIQAAIKKYYGVEIFDLPTRQNGRPVQVTV